MTYSLRRIQPEDGAGDSGSYFTQFKLVDGVIEELKDEEFPQVGCAVRVGSYHARTYSAQDYWTTTPITEILERKDDGDEVTIIFKTGNSTYEWKRS